MQPTDPKASQGASSDASHTSREPIFAALTGEEKRLLYELERELWFEQINGRPIMPDGENKKGRPK